MQAEKHRKKKTPQKTKNKKTTPKQQPIILFYVIFLRAIAEGQKSRMGLKTHRLQTPGL